MTLANASPASVSNLVGKQRRPDATFSRVVGVIAAAPLLIGLLHASLGVTLNATLGAVLSPAVVSDPVLDSQDRFQGVLFMGYGALIYLSLKDLKRYAAVFRIACAALALGGVARLLSIALRGLPPAPVLVLTGIEVVLVPLILGWHARVLARL